MKYSLKSFYLLFLGSMGGIAPAVWQVYSKYTLADQETKSLALGVCFTLVCEMIFAAFVICAIINIYLNVRRMYNIMDRIYKKPEIMKVKPKLREPKFEDTFE